MQSPADGRPPKPPRCCTQLLAHLAAGYREQLAVTAHPEYPSQDDRLAALQAVLAAAVVPVPPRSVLDYLRRHHPAVPRPTLPTTTIGPAAPGRDRDDPPTRPSRVEQMTAAQRRQERPWERDRADISRAIGEGPEACQGQSAFPRSGQDHFLIRPGSFPQAARGVRQTDMGFLTGSRKDP